MKAELVHIRNGSKTTTSGARKFSDMVVQQGNQLQLHKLLADVSTAGERLSHSQTFKELAIYKNLVKRFMKEAVEFGMQLKTSHSWNEFAEGKTLHIVETIDQKLLELTDEVMEQEKQTIHVLNKIGEIKGLLISLYT